MLRFITLAIAAIAWTGSALAENVETTSSISNGSVGVEKIHGDDTELRYLRDLRRRNIESVAKTDIFERRLAGQARRSIGSICDRCLALSSAVKIERLYRIVNPNSDEMRIEDPAQAPLD